MHNDDVHAEYATSDENDEKGILDYVLDLIDEDLGEGHLEYFQHSDLDLDVQFSDLPSIWVYNLVQVNGSTSLLVQPIDHIPELSHSGGYIAYILSRGPPQV